MYKYIHTHTHPKRIPYHIIRFDISTSTTSTRTTIACFGGLLPTLLWKNGKTPDATNLHANNRLVQCSNIRISSHSGLEGFDPCFVFIVFETVAYMYKKKELPRKRKNKQSVCSGQKSPFSWTHMYVLVPPQSLTPTP